MTGLLYENSAFNLHTTKIKLSTYISQRQSNTTHKLFNTDKSFKLKVHFRNNYL